MIKLKNILKESYNQSDVNYAMKMAFDSIPGNWHKALKRVKYSKRNKSIKLNMSSYMGPGKVLQKIVDEFNRSMGTKYKIDKDSFVKGSVTGIELRESINEDGHTDIPSAIRKCKLIIDDAKDILEKLGEKNQEDDLPAWWMSKITLAADYVNKADNYINTSGQLNDGSYEHIRKDKSE